MDGDENVQFAYIELMKKVLTASIYEESGWELKSPSNYFKKCC
jgi:hypothetical protein